MPPNRELPWRRRSKTKLDSEAGRWWGTLWKSRSAWAIAGAVISFVLIQGVDSLTNLRKLPAETQQTWHTFLSWYYDDAQWTGTWSSREEGSADDLNQAKEPLKITIKSERGVVSGEMFNRKVCDLNPMLPPILLEGEISSGRLLANAFVFQGGTRRYLYSIEAVRSADEPVITVKPAQRPTSLLPSSARLARRIGGLDVEHSDDEHSDLKCPESPLEYLQRLRDEGVLKGVDELFPKSTPAQPQEEPSAKRD